MSTGEKRTPSGSESNDRRIIEVAWRLIEAAASRHWQRALGTRADLKSEIENLKSYKPAGDPKSKIQNHPSPQSPAPSYGVKR
jgi:hypothetical protein